MLREDACKLAMPVSQCAAMRIPYAPDINRSADALQGCQLVMIGRQKKKGLVSRSSLNSHSHSAHRHPRLCGAILLPSSCLGISLLLRQPQELSHSDPSISS